MTPPGGAWRLSVSSAGAHFAMAPFGDETTVWDPSGTVLQRFTPVPGHDPWQAQLFRGPDGRERLATNGTDHRLLVRDVSSGASAFLMELPAGVGQAFDLASESGLAAIGSSSGQLSIVDVLTGSLVVRAQAGEGSLDGVFFDRAGETLLTSSTGGDAMLWDPRTGALLRALEGHQGPIVSGTFAPDGALVATAGEDNSVRVWRTRTGERVHTFPIEVGTMATLAFSPDGRRLSVITNRGGITVWRVGQDARPDDVVERVGRATNLRTCRDSHKVVPVAPYGDAAEFWAPSEACRDGGAAGP